MMRLLLVGAMVMASVMPAGAAMEDYPSVQLKALDKSTARTTTFEVKVGSTIQYGALYIKVQACRKAEPLDKPESAAFLQIWELPPEETDSKWVFSGWMFASSPALSAMDHPVYDVWVLNCLGKEEPNEEAAASETDAEADQSGLDQPAPDGETPAITPNQPSAGESGEPAIQEEEPLLD